MHRLATTHNVNTDDRQTDGRLKIWLHSISISDLDRRFPVRRVAVAGTTWHQSPAHSTAALQWLAAGNSTRLSADDNTQHWTHYFTAICLSLKNNQLPFTADDLTFFCWENFRDCQSVTWRSWFSALLEMELNYWCLHELRLGRTIDH